MNAMGTVRSIRNRGARSALIAGVAAWLGFVAQPCVMAAPMGGTLDYSGFESSLVMHHGAGAPPHECPHCVEVNSTAALATGTCDDASAASGLPATNPLDDGENGWTPAVPFAVLPDLQRIVLRSIGMPKVEHIPRTVSLTVAYCVYLE